MSQNMAHWMGCLCPQPQVFDGRYVRLELLGSHHGDELFQASFQPDREERFRYLADSPPQSREEFDIFMNKASASLDPLFFVVVNKETGQVGGRQSLLNIDRQNGVIEIGHIYWGSEICNRRQATEAQFLLADYVFSLGYRRYEWKCDNENIASKNAALRFGFNAEGVFRQHRVVKGKNRDTAWFAMLDRDWLKLRGAYIKWLEPENFDAQGRQKTRLTTLINDMKTS